jgi:uncharacterized protein YaiE (UPF0345 family)
MAKFLAALPMTKLCARIDPRSSALSAEKRNSAPSAVKTKRGIREKSNLPTGRRPRHFSGMPNFPEKFAGVTVVTKANIYFDGKVVSHSVVFADGTKKTLGLIYPGSYHFGTGAPERMEIIAGACRATLDGQTAIRDYAAGQSFDVPGKSGFTIEVASGICEYICSFLAA